jgi:hypothetical protein
MRIRSVQLPDRRGIIVEISHSFLAGAQSSPVAQKIADMGKNV